jgi:hypothetical protein
MCTVVVVCVDAPLVFQAPEHDLDFVAQLESVRSKSICIFRLALAAMQAMGTSVETNVTWY